jgi:FMN-dependent NADH-azoreductase
MTHILHIMGSPRTNDTASGEVARTYINAYASNAANCEIDTLDVWKEHLPDFDEEVMNAKYAGIYGQALTERQQHAWATLAPLVERIVGADVIVLSVPMWNFGIPYRLKHFIDLVSQKDYLFRFDETGFSGMANAKVVLVCSRGLNFATGTDTPEAEFDYQKSYMLMWLKFIGLADIETITLEQLVFGSEADASARAGANEIAVQLAARHSQALASTNRLLA